MGKLGLAQRVPTRQPTCGIMLAVGALVLTGAGAAAWVYSRLPATRQGVLTVTPLTSYPGSERSPSFSPDGNQVAFSWDGEHQDNFDIYVRLLDGGTPLRLTTDAAVDSAPAWSPDGRVIAFFRNIVNRVSIMLISPLGGAERKLTDLSPFGSSVSRLQQLAWTPDSRFLAFSDRPSDAETRRIFLISIADGQ
jgi:Tol biopolymer transport system component